MTTALPISYTLPSVSAGRYVFKVIARDLNGNVASANSTEFEVKEGFHLDRVMNSPNPFNPRVESTQIDYLLSRNAEVELYIYALSGELQWHVHVGSGESGGQVGYNRVVWDGKNTFGEEVANGVYLAYVVAKADGKVEKGKVKLWVRK